MMFKQKVLKTIKKYSLLNKNDNVLVALSGGADSVSLLCVLLMLKDELSLTVEAAHVNHMIRKEADSDTEFVKKLCERNNVKLHILKEDIIGLSQKWGFSEEKTGRIVRYNFFDKIVDGKNMKIATAHTKDDCGENFLICALRGTLPKGIPPKRDNVVRPLIEITKDEIYEFLNTQKQDFVVDKTNFLTDYTRNKVRLEIIPFINEKFHTDFANNVYNGLDVLYFEDEYMKSEAKRLTDEICVFKDDIAQIDIDRFNSVHTALKRRILKEIYYTFASDGFLSFEHISSVIELCEKKETGKKTQLPKKVEAVVSYNKLKIFKKNKENIINDFEYSLKLNEKIYIHELEKNVYVNDNGKGESFFSSDKFFKVRNRRTSDKVYIENVGHKKLKNLFIDKKTEREKRNNLIVLTDESGICFVENTYKKTKNNKDNNKLYIYIGD